MKRTTNRLIATIAITGLLSGATVHQARARDDAGSTKNSATSPGKAAKKVPKVSDCAGTNDCKGLGGCKTDEHTCKFKNSCKGKGGCHITKADIKKWEKMQKEKEKKS
ncbi:MAG TPA: hypothetical protein VFB72_15525 [Verrucomicrobiae bacterium]|nr:hypothetical protein [Verrucomicrobiae bacterium]